ncbi:hypothetical protein [Ralstonia pseudosolanacearum]|uniref:hypothetical protein n=1 Tax=Ralstonia pseudosolanacearum TaxID=1310165 RepID=UPI0011CE322E|nr:hypothetical protein [Ralstonia pseudosolanacearum]
MSATVPANRLPYSVVILLCVIAYLVGHQTAAPAKNIAVAEKGAVVLEAALSRPGVTEAQMKAQVAEPILSILRRYQERGYMVIDTSRNEQGDMTVAALPANTLDITNELRAAVNLPAQQPAPALAPATNAPRATGHE